MRKQIVKTTALLTALLFSVTQLGVSPQSWASVSTAFASEVKVLAPSFQISIPPELGSIQNLNSSTGPVLIHIQSAHGNYGAQKNIEAILHHLKNEYGIKTLFVEGSPYKLKPERIRFFPKDMPRTREVADKLAKRALLKGAELYLIDETEAEAYGIEDLEAYRENVKAFREVMSQKDEMQKSLSAIRREMETKAARHLSREAREFLKSYDKFDSGEFKMVDWLSILKTKAKKHLDLDLQSPALQLEWPMLVRMYTLQRLEEGLNLKKYQKEKKKFFNHLSHWERSSQRPSEGTLSQIKALLNQPLSHHELPDPETSQLFEHLVATLPANFQFDRYPNVKRFIAHLMLRSEIKAKALFEEIEVLTEQISQSFATTQEAKQVLKEYKRNRLMRKLFSLELTPKDYEDLRMLSPLPLGEVGRETPGEGPHPGQPLAVSPSPKGRGDDMVNKALNFYTWAKKRDDFMIQNLETKINELGIQKAVVITGGFHAKPFEEHFKEQGFNYALITPKMKDLEGKDAYIESLLQTNTLESIFQALSRSEIRSAGFDPNHFDRALFEIAGISRSESRLEMNRLDQFEEVLQAVIQDPSQTGKVTLSKPDINRYLRENNRDLGLFKDVNLEAWNQAFRLVMNGKRLGKENPLLELRNRAQSSLEFAERGVTSIQIISDPKQEHNAANFAGKALVELHQILTKVLRSKKSLNVSLRPKRHARDNLMFFPVHMKGDVILGLGMLNDLIREPNHIAYETEFLLKLNQAFKRFFSDEPPAKVTPGLEYLRRLAQELKENRFKITSLTVAPKEDKTKLNGNRRTNPYGYHRWMVLKKAHSLISKYKGKKIKLTAAKRLKKTHKPEDVSGGTVVGVVSQVEWIPRENENATDLVVHFSTIDSQQTSKAFRKVKNDKVIRFHRSTIGHFGLIHIELRKNGKWVAAQSESRNEKLGELKGAVDEMLADEWLDEKHRKEIQKLYILGKQMHELQFSSFEDYVDSFAKPLLLEMMGIDLYRALRSATAWPLRNLFRHFQWAQNESYPEGALESFYEELPEAETLIHLQVVESSIPQFPVAFEWKSDLVGFNNQETATQKAQAIASLIYRSKWLEKYPYSLINLSTAELFQVKENAPYDFMMAGDIIAQDEAEAVAEKAERLRAHELRNGDNVAKTVNLFDPFDREANHKTNASDLLRILNAKALENVFRLHAYDHVREGKGQLFSLVKVDINRAKKMIAELKKQSSRLDQEGRGWLQNQEAVMWHDVSAFLHEQDLAGYSENEYRLTEIRMKIDAKITEAENLKPTEGVALESLFRLAEKIQDSGLADTYLEPLASEIITPLLEYNDPHDLYVVLKSRFARPLWTFYLLIEGAIETRIFHREITDEAFARIPRGDDWKMELLPLAEGFPVQAESPLNNPLSDEAKEKLQEAAQMIVQSGWLGHPNVFSSLHTVRFSSEDILRKSILDIATAIILEDQANAFEALTDRIRVYEQHEGGGNGSIISNPWKNHTRESVYQVLPILQQIGTRSRFLLAAKKQVREKLGQEKITADAMLSLSRALEVLPQIEDMIEDYPNYAQVWFRELKILWNQVQQDLERVSNSESRLQELMAKLEGKLNEDSRLAPIVRVMKARVQLLDPRDVDAKRILEENLKYFIDGGEPYEKKENPKVTVVIVHYGSVEDTLGALQNLSVQDYENFNVLILDNNSPDDFAVRYEAGEFNETIPEKIQKKLDVHKSPYNLGYAHGNNYASQIALKKHNADGVFIMNPDLAISRNTLSSVTSKASEYEDVGMVSPSFAWYDAEESHPDRVAYRGLRETGENKAMAARASIFQVELSRPNLDENAYLMAVSLGAAFYARSDFIRATGGFDHRLFMYGDEQQIGFMAALAGYRLAMVKDAYLAHEDPEVSKRGYGRIYLAQRNQFLMLQDFQRIDKAKDDAVLHIILNDINERITTLLLGFNGGFEQISEAMHRVSINDRWKIIVHYAVVIKAMIDGISSVWEPTLETRDVKVDENKKIEDYAQEFSKMTDPQVFLKRFLLEEDPYEVRLMIFALNQTAFHFDFQARETEVFLEAVQKLDITVFERVQAWLGVIKKQEPASEFEEGHEAFWNSLKDALSESRGTGAKPRGEPGPGEAIFEALKPYFYGLDSEVDQMDSSGDIANPDHKFRRLYHILERTFQSIDQKVKDKEIYPWVPELKVLREGPTPNLDDLSQWQLERAPRIGVFGLTANPLNWGHILVTLMAIDLLNLDKVIYVIHGDISYKDPDPRRDLSIDARHAVAAEDLKAFEPFLAYSDVSKPNKDVMETNLYNLLGWNLNRELNIFPFFGGEETERVKKVFKLYKTPYEETEWAKHKEHKIKIGIIQRGEFGEKMTKDVLMKTAQDIGLTLPFIQVKHEDIDLQISSTAYVDTYNPKLVPPKSHEVYSTLAKSESRGVKSYRFKSAFGDKYPIEMHVFDPQKSRFQVVVRPEPNGVFHYNQQELDRSKRAVWADGRIGDPVYNAADVNWTWEEIEAKVPLAEDESLHISSYHNLYYNEWSVVYDGNTQMLYRRDDEPFSERTYTMFVSWKDGTYSSEKVYFEEHEDVFHVYRREGDSSKNLGPKINFAVWGQQLIQDFQARPLQEMAGEFSDVFHLYQLPQSYQNNNGAVRYGEPFGQDEIMRLSSESPARSIVAEHRSRLHQALQNNGIVEIPFASYLETYGNVSKFETELLQAETFNGRRYTRTLSKENLQTGQYFLDTSAGTVHIRLYTYPYPHNLIGITESGKPFTLILSGDKSQGFGYPVQEIAAKVKELESEIGERVQHLFLMANSRDAFNRIDGKFTVTSGPEVYDAGSAALTFITPKVASSESHAQQSSSTSAGDDAKGFRFTIIEYTKLQRTVMYASSHLFNKKYLFSQTPVLATVFGIGTVLLKLLYLGIVSLWNYLVGTPMANKGRYDFFWSTRFAVSPQVREQVIALLKNDPKIQNMRQRYAQAGISGASFGVFFLIIENKRSFASVIKLDPKNKGLQSIYRMAGYNIEDFTHHLTLNSAAILSYSAKLASALLHELWHPLADKLGNLNLEDGMAFQNHMQEVGWLSYEVAVMLKKDFTEYLASRVKVKHNGVEEAIFDFEHTFEFFSEEIFYGNMNYASYVSGLILLYLRGYQAFRFDDPEKAAQNLKRIRDYFGSRGGEKTLKAIENFLGVDQKNEELRQLWREIKYPSREDATFYAGSFHRIITDETIKADFFSSRKAFQKSRSESRPNVIAPVRQHFEGRSEATQQSQEEKGFEFDKKENLKASRSEGRASNSIGKRLKSALRAGLYFGLAVGVATGYSSNSFDIHAALKGFLITGSIAAVFIEFWREALWLLGRVLILISILSSASDSSESKSSSAQDEKKSPPAKSESRSNDNTPIHQHFERRSEAAQSQDEKGFELTWFHESRWSVLKGIVSSAFYGPVRVVFFGHRVKDPRYQILKVVRFIEAGYGALTFLLSTSWNGLIGWWVSNLLESDILYWKTKFNFSPKQEKEINRLALEDSHAIEIKQRYISMGLSGGAFAIGYDWMEPLTIMGITNSNWFEGSGKERS